MIKLLKYIIGLILKLFKKPKYSCILVCDYVWCIEDNLAIAIKNI